MSVKIFFLNKVGKLKIVYKMLVMLLSSIELINLVKYLNNTTFYSLKFNSVTT